MISRWVPVVRSENGHGLATVETRTDRNLGKQGCGLEGPAAGLHGTQGGQDGGGG